MVGKLGLGATNIVKEESIQEKEIYQLIAQDFLEKKSHFLINQPSTLNPKKRHEPQSCVINFNQGNPNINWVAKN